jgi:hypothetical protein
MTLDTLIAIWEVRDHRYTFRRRVHFEASSIAAIRAYREREVDELPRPVQARARAELALWTMPGSV